MTKIAEFHNRNPEEFLSKKKFENVKCYFTGDSGSRDIS